ncbi:MAG: nucleotidyltransferase family protein [Candidatus Electrothrix aestuarii]|uniref:Nucleotidyltransferase family protein n=1 Tax=Candidatus Electrothrix aestuarii TaxID=3062594 RepID=A0AAU8LUK5_9BACT|nr:nucleotidyltransferase family protein [Candidatus Electrothrix aestuarii]
MHPLLQLCARIEPHPVQQKRLAQACSDFATWDDLIQQAEAHGMAPLLLRHFLAAGLDVPDDFLRHLRLLVLRHRQTNRVLSRTLGKVLSILAEAGIPALVLKGAALCQTLYPDPGLRPMRDIDLLLPWDEALPAHALLQRHGFQDPAVFTPVDHLHLAALYLETDGIKVCLELHRSLFPDCPPCPARMDFATLSNKAVSFTADGVPAYTLANEEMIWHLYQHGFHAPLTYDPFKLISAADLISFVETKLDEIDWDRIKSKYPHLLAALPHLHHLTPWNDTVRERLGFGEETALTGVGASFTGWPRRKLAALKGQPLRVILRDTFLPPDWWLRIYYAPTGRFGRLQCLFIKHPGHIFWWVKLYWSIFLKESLPEEEISAPIKLRDVPVIIKNSGKLIAALWRKVH